LSRNLVHGIAEDLGIFANQQTETIITGPIHQSMKDELERVVESGQTGAPWACNNMFPWHLPRNPVHGITDNPGRKKNGIFHVITSDLSVRV
jgi:hypothetical protein